YDPAWAYEVSVIVADGLRRMYGESPEHPHGEDIFYYLTVYNEPYQQPAMPVDSADARAALEQAVLRGLDRYAPAAAGREGGRAWGGRRGGTGADPRLRGGRALGAGGAAAARRGLGRGGGRVVGDVLDGAAPRRARLRGVEPAQPRRAGPRALRDRGAGGPGRPGGRGERLDPGGAGSERPVGARAVHRAGHRGVRLLRHPAGRPPVLPRGRAVDHAGGAQPARPARRGQARDARPGDREVPAGPPGQRHDGRAVSPGF